MKARWMGVCAREEEGEGELPREKIRKDDGDGGEEAGIARSALSSKGPARARALIALASAAAHLDDEAKAALEQRATRSAR